MFNSVPIRNFPKFYFNCSANIESELCFKVSFAGISKYILSSSNISVHKLNSFHCQVKFLDTRVSLAPTYVRYKVGPQLGHTFPTDFEQGKVNYFQDRSSCLAIQPRICGCIAVDYIAKNTWLHSKNTWLYSQEFLAIQLLTMQP